MRKPIVYVASPYTKGDPAINTHFQVTVFNRLLDDGKVCPIIPLVSHYLHGVHPRPYKDWIQYDLDLLHGVDACVRLDAVNEAMGYHVSESSGADGEVAYCEELGKPVFYSIEDLYHWVDQRSRLPEPTVFDAMLRAVNAYEDKHKKVPVVLGVELYEHFGEWCTITNVNVFRGGEIGEVTVENRSGNITTIDYEELSLRPSRPVRDG